MKKNFAVICLIIALPISFFIGWVVCLFQATPDTDKKEIASAIAEATSELRSDLKEAKDEAKAAKAELAELKSSKSKYNGDSDIYKEIFNAIFYKEEEKFVMKDSEFKFYSDISCSPDSLITDDLTFVTSRDVDGKNASGSKVFFSRSTKGPTFSLEQPYFDYK